MGRPKKPQGKDKIAAQDATGDSDASGAAAFAALGPPPLDDPDTALVWVRKFQLVGLHLAATDPSLTLKERLSRVQELSKACGLTNNHARLEERFKKLQDDEGGPPIKRGPGRPRKDQTVKHSGQLTRPAYARGGSATGGPDPVSGSLPDPDASDDGDPDPMGGGPMGSPH